jgi:hypothetical protein
VKHKPTKNLKVLEPNIDIPTSIASKASDDAKHDQVIFDPKATSILPSLFSISDLEEINAILNNTNKESFSKTASVKFMITLQDERDLCRLGYSKEQIDKLKPQEAVDIIEAGMKVEPTNSPE